LAGCVNDAVAVANMLERNGDGSPNFAVRLLASNRDTVSTYALSEAIAELFMSEADTVLLFFAGHGIINPYTNAGYLVTQDGRRGSWGVAISDVLTQANRAHPGIKSSIIILDSCNSGFAGEVPALANEHIATLGTGLTILTACHRDGTAAEAAGRGVFTGLLLDALNGGAADICGRITPASVYSHVDQALGPWEQRPIYKANVQTFVTLREVAPKIPFGVLRRLPEYFPDPSHEFSLDPSFEPDRQNVPEQVRGLPIDEEHVRVFKELQMCNRHGLVVPVRVEHMYYAAIGSTGCRLTALGAHYRKLAAMNRL
jgi:hypothetical protein